MRSYFTAHVNDMNSAFQFDDFGTALNTDGNNYDLVERITAGYFMNSIDLGRVRIQTGLRFEATHEGLLGNKVTDPLSGSTLPTVTPLPVDSSYLDPLPSVQVRFRLPHDAAIRAVYGRGISRPNFSDLPPTFDTQSDAGQKVHVGNPFLKPTHANNYDLLYEQYLKPL